MVPVILTPDICVIGAGSGGLSVAAAAAAFGVEVVLVERGRMGGDCLNTGCVPSKALLAAARRAHHVRTAAELGIHAGEPTIVFPSVMAHVRRTIAAIAPNDSVARFTAMGVKVIQASARFIDAESVEAGDFLVRARRFVVATGSRAAMPPISGLAEAGALTNETIFEFEELPAHLLVIGAGPVGVELAQAFRRLGSRVTILEARQPLANEDPECARFVLDALVRDGVELIAPASVRRVEREAGGAVRAIVERDGREVPIEGSHLLVATGRIPVTDGLDLERAGIASTESGITVDGGLRTTNRRVFAIGDVAGSWQFTHLANHHAGLVIRSILFRLPVKASTRAIPRVTYTDPELAQVGMTEAEAKAGSVRVLRWSFHENDRARTEGVPTGEVKLVISRRGRILGATVVGPDAGEMIALLQLALARRMSVRDLAAATFAYPTLSEAVRRAALSFYTPGLTKPLLRRILALLRRFG